MPNTPQSLAQQIWSQGDHINQFVAIVLIAMSVTTWVIILLKAFDQYRQRKLAHHIEHFWHSTNLEQGLEKLSPSPRNHFYLLARRGYEALEHIKKDPSKEQFNTPMQLHDSLNISEWVTRGLKQSIEVSFSSLQSGLALLGSIGSTAPFIGLFGTVWGIYHALMRLGEQAGAKGQGSMELIAGPIGEALIMTALGLGVAIPAVLGYNALTRGNKSIVSQLNRFAEDLHAYFVTGSRVEQRS